MAHTAVDATISNNPITQIDFARAGEITDAMRIVAEKEGRDPEWVRDGVACGRIAIPANIHHKNLSPEASAAVCVPRSTSTSESLGTS